MIKKESSIGDLHPMAIAFVKDYLDENETRLEKMKSSSAAQFRLIDNILTRYHLPSELKYLAVIESNMKSGATSNKGCSRALAVYARNRQIDGTEDYFNP